jgi:hypothetical protein
MHSTRGSRSGTVTEGPDEHQLVALRGRWSTAEARIYPMAMVSVPAYEQALTAVATLLDHLRSEVHDTAALVRFAEHPDAARRLLDVPALELAGLTFEDLVGAACASRDRELALQEECRRRLEAIEAAPPAADRVDVPFRRAFGLLATVPELRVLIAARRGLRTSLEADVETGAPRLRVVPVAVDLSTGELTVAPEHADLDLVVDDRAAWDEAWTWFAGEWED